MSATIDKIYSIFRENSNAITTDSRAVACGDLFVALSGDNFDGNQFAAAALKNGAAAAVVDRKFAESDRGAESLDDQRYIIVEDTLAALQSLANHHRRQLGLEIVALTGSNGKTTTKELITRVLSSKYRVASTKGNLNNHIGVPLTLLSFNSEHQIGIVEMGANHQHEIETLCRIAQPNCGLITNIGRAHLEGFGGAEGVRRGKGEMFDYLAEQGGVAIYSTHDQTISDMVAERSRERLQLEGYSLDEFDLRSSVQNSEQMLCVQSHGVAYQTALIGGYNIHNIAAAVAIGRHYAVETATALEAVTHYTPDNNRSQAIKSGSNTLYMDAYNANPSSMEAALSNFDTLAVSPKVLIVGDMRELGDYATAEHRALLERISAMSQLKLVILVGQELAQAFSTMHDKFKNIEIHSFATVDQASSHLARNPLADSHVLIKGSRGIALEKLF